MLGNSPQQWAITIGVMFLSMGLGSDYQKKIADKDILKKFYCYEWFLSLIGGLGPLLMLAIFSLDRLHYMTAQYCFVFFVGFVIGMEIPILLRLNARHQSALSVNLATILRFDYFGGFVGALVWAFVLLRYLPSMIETALILGMFNLTSSFLIVVFATPQKERKFVGITWPKIAFPSFLLLLGILTGGLIFSKGIVAHLEQRLFRDPVIASKASPYQRIVLTQNRHGIVHCYINGQLQFSSIDEHIYHETLVHPAMLMNEKRKNILILGGGDGLALREVLKYDEVEKVTLVDIDATMIELASKNEALVRLNNHAFDNAKVWKKALSPIPTQTYQDVYWHDLSTFPVKQGWNTQVFVYIIDARDFLEQAKGSYDVVIIDFPDPQSVELSKLYTLSFYRMLTRKLNKNAIISQQSTSPLLTKNTFLLIGQTLKAAGYKTLPLRAGVPSFGEWGFWLGKWTNNPTKWENASQKNQKENLRHQKLFESFLALKKDENLKKMPLRHLSTETWKTLAAFPPSIVTNKNIFVEKKQINTLINGIIWKTYLQESDKY